MIRQLFVGEKTGDTLVVSRGGWVQRLGKDGSTGDGARDAGMTLFPKLGQWLSVGGVDVNDWADLAICEVVTLFPLPSKMVVRALAGTVRDGRVYVEVVARWRSTRTAREAQVRAAAGAR